MCNEVNKSKYSVYLNNKYTFYLIVESSSLEIFTYREREKGV